MGSEDSGAAAPSCHHSELQLLRAPATTTQNSSCSDVLPHTAATTQSSSCSELQLLRVPAAQSSSHHHSELQLLSSPTTHSCHHSELQLLRALLLRAATTHNSSCSELQPPPLRAQKSCPTPLPPLSAPAAPLPQSAPQSFTSVTLFTKYAHNTARCSHCSEMICSSETLLLPTIGNLNPPCFAYGPEVAM